LAFRKWLMVLLSQKGYWFILLATASGLIFSIIPQVAFFSIKTAMGEEKENHSGRKYCALILKKLAGKKQTFGGKLYFFTTVRKTEYLEQPTGGYIYENPTSVSFGIRFMMPLIDQREKLQRLKDYLNRLNTARKLLSDYLTLRREIEAWEKYLLWRKKRVCYGIEYLTNFWRDTIDIETKKEELKALETQLCLLGIPKGWLDLCYKATIKEMPKYPYPAGVPQCNATTP